MDGASGTPDDAANAATAGQKRQHDGDGAEQPEKRARTDSTEAQAADGPEPKSEVVDEKNEVKKDAEEAEDGEYVADEPLPERPMAPAYHSHAEPEQPALSFSPTGADEEGQLADDEKAPAALAVSQPAPLARTVEPATDSLPRVAAFRGLADFSAYEPSVKVGEGTFGMVVKAKHRDSGDTVALKLIRQDDLDKHGFPITALREIALLKTLSHPNVLKLREMVVMRDASGNPRLNQFYMSFDFYPHDLAGLLERHEPGYFGLPVYKLWAKQILEGMYYLHKNNIVHRDVKSANILLSHSGHLLLADFGLARPLDVQNQNREYTDKVVTRWYRPPELLLGSSKYGPAVDMWGVGCVIAELYSHRPVMPGNSELDQYTKVFEFCGSFTDDNYPGWQLLPEVESLKAQGIDFAKPFRHRAVKSKMVDYYKADRGGADLVDKLLLLNPKKRWSAQQALGHDWFYSNPRPARVGEIPRYMDSHEMDIRGGGFEVVRRPPEEKERERRGWDSYVPGGSAGADRDRGRESRDRDRDRDGQRDPERPWGVVENRDRSRDRRRSRSRSPRRRSSRSPRR